MNRPTVVDLFAGAGLFSYAFREEGFEIIQAVEHDEFAAESYRSNIGNVLEVVDILDVVPVGPCDVLIAGPPCQGFSTLGKRDPDDSRNWLSLEILRWVDEARPQVAIVENVAGFLTSPAYRSLAKGLRLRGYSVVSDILNALDFGVPQRRERAFVVATRTGRPFAAHRVMAGCRTLREAWCGLPLKPTGEDLHVAPIPAELALRRMRVLPYGGDKRDILRLAPELAAPSWFRYPNSVTDVWGRMKWEGPSNTLRTCFQNPSKGRYIHPEQNRVLTVREGARLQTIPDHWAFVGPRTRIVSQIGNAVPPLLGRSIARGVRQIL